MTNVLTSNFPELNFDCFEIPTPTEDVPYAYHRYNGESTFGVNKNAPADQQAVAQDIVRYFFANDELEKEFCMANSVFPAKIMLEDVFYNNADLDTALQSAEDAINEDLAGSGFASQESVYKYASEAIH